MGYVASVFTAVAEHGLRPASDADLGRVVRRLAGIYQFRLELLEQLLDLWDRVDGGAADESDRERANRVDALLDPPQFPDEDAPPAE